MKGKWDWIAAQCLYFKLDHSYRLAARIADLLGTNDVPYWTEEERDAIRKRMRMFTNDTICRELYRLAQKSDAWCGEVGVCPKDCPILMASNRCFFGGSLIDHFLEMLEKETFF
ncbi:MAG: hypothetical protein KKC55_17045, partial [Gammaproteobacteria bacterium]|nr:hypothetical protein [Gammaproteobacteria bacterium]